jgi:hypothetical protein
VLSAEDNEILTRVGPGTPMGSLLRRYWIPACLIEERCPHLGSTDVALIRFHRQLIRTAKALAAADGDAGAAGLPALGGSGDFQAIRGAEKILADGEDWRVLGTGADPAVREALGR